MGKSQICYAAGPPWIRIFQVHPIAAQSDLVLGNVGATSKLSAPFHIRWHCLECHSMNLHWSEVININHYNCQCCYSYGCSVYVSQVTVSHSPSQPLLSPPIGQSTLWIQEGKDKGIMHLWCTVIYVNMSLTWAVACYKFHSKKEPRLRKNGVVSLGSLPKPIFTSEIRVQISFETNCFPMRKCLVNLQINPMSQQYLTTSA